MLRYMSVTPLVVHSNLTHTSTNAYPYSQAPPNFSPSRKLKWGSCLLTPFFVTHRGELLNLPMFLLMGLANNLHVLLFILGSVPGSALCASNHSSSTFPPIHDCQSLGCSLSIYMEAKKRLSSPFEIRGGGEKNAKVWFW